MGKITQVRLSNWSFWFYEVDCILNGIRLEEDKVDGDELGRSIDASSAVDIDRTVVFDDLTE